MRPGERGYVEEVVLPVSPTNDLDKTCQGPEVSESPVSLELKLNAVEVVEQTVTLERGVARG